MGVPPNHQFEQDFPLKTSRYPLFWKPPLQQNLRKIFMPRGFHQDLFKSLSQGPVQDPKASDSISQGSPHHHLHTRNCKRPRPTSSFQGPVREFHKISKKRTCCCWRGSYKILIQEPPKNLPQELSYKPLRHCMCKTFMQGPLRKDPTRISTTRSSVKDPYRILQGPPQSLRGEFIRIPARPSRKDQRMIMQTPLRGCQQDLHKILSEGPVRDHARTSVSISSTTSSYKDLYKTLVKTFIQYAP